MKTIKKWKLSTKLAVWISMLLTITFAIQIFFSTSLMEQDMRGVIYAELDAISARNGTEARNILSFVETVLLNMRNYLSTMDKDSMGAREYLLAEASSTVQNSSAAAGIGVMAEPGIFGGEERKNSFYLDDKTLTAQEPKGGYESYSKEEWYQKARSGQTAVCGPYYAQDDRQLLTLAVPFERDGMFAGVVKADMNVEALDGIEIDTDRYKSMYGLLFNSEAAVIYDSRGESTIGKALKEVFRPQTASAVEEAAVQAGGQPFTLTIRTDQGKRITGYFSPVAMMEETWWSMTALDTKEMEKAGLIEAGKLSCLAAAALFILVGIVFWLMYKRLKPIGGIVEAAEKISRGELEVSLAAQTQDEIGILTETFDDTARTLRVVIRDISRVLNGIANKDLTVEAEAEYVGELSGIRDAMNHIGQNLNRVMEEINRSAGEVANGSEQLAAGAQQLAQGATEQAASSSELASRITELFEQIGDSASYAHEAKEKAGQVREQAEESGRRIQELLSAMQEIEASSIQVQEIIKTISDIAFQTKILALNAAVEAARAGEAGNGFAIVAEEVGRLAQQSDEASANTAKLLGHSLSAVETGTEKARETAEFIRNGIKSIQEITGKVEKISDKAGSQAIAIEQIMEGVNQISAVVQSNSAAAQESAAASEELSSQAQLMHQMISEFKLKDEA